ncbi:MAG: tetratricopeptide repeat protein, partial [Deltaproteobacteria bacterium]|nr:tetratricopeptide repeat protein [Deltaproteobacteria bacterium]
EAHHYLGRVVAAQGQLGEAVEHFRDALRIQPEFADAHESLGRALAQQGKRDEAVKHYQEALRIMKSGAGAASPR